jgi:transcriptional regulator with GAF, ATPase, and Fis domain
VSTPDMQDTVFTDREWRDRERANLVNALKRAHGRIYGSGGAADLLGVKPTTLASRLRALRIKAQDAR